MLHKPTLDVEEKKSSRRSPSPYKKPNNDIKMIESIRLSRSNSPNVYKSQGNWKPLRKARFDKAVQVYDDILRQKYKRKKVVANKMIQTDDIPLDKIALEQHEFHFNTAYGRHYRFSKKRHAATANN